MLYNTSQVQQVQLAILHFHCQALPERAYVCIIKSLWKPSSTFVDFTGSILQGFTSAYSARICLHCYMCKVSIKSLWTPRSSPGLDLCVWEDTACCPRLGKDMRAVGVSLVCSSADRSARQHRPGRPPGVFSRRICTVSLPALTKAKVCRWGARMDCQGCNKQSVVQGAS